MAERSYEQMQARAISSVDDSFSGALDAEERADTLARAQVHALLAVGAAIKDLAAAIRERG